MLYNTNEKFNHITTKGLTMNNQYLYIKCSQNDSTSNTSNPPKLKKKSEYTLKHDLEMLSFPTFMYTCISYA